MTARTVLLIESAILTPETSPTAMPLIADRRADGGLTFTTLDEATRIELHADDLRELLAYAAPPTLEIRGDTIALTAGASHSPSPATSDPSTERIAHAVRSRQERVDAALAHIRSIAVEGMMPSAAQYDGSRGPDHIGSGTLTRELRCTWTEIAPQLGLELTERQRMGLLRIKTGAQPVVSKPAPEPEPEPVVESAAQTVPAAPATNGHHAAEEAAAKRAALCDEAVAELRRIGHGRMPKMSEYNLRKPAHLPRAAELMPALGVEHWGEMAKIAGLPWKPGER